MSVHMKAAIATAIVLAWAAALVLGPEWWKLTNAAVMIAAIIYCGAYGAIQIWQGR